MMSWESFCCLGYIMIVLIEPWIWVEHCRSSVEIFHAILSVIGTTTDLTWGSDFVHLSRLHRSKLTTYRLVNGSSCDEIEMDIKDLDLEPKDIVTKFCSPSRWKELRKETSSKILLCGDGSCWKMFKPIASLITKGKLK
nr:hypothetical protein [Tanacetum cinerariifolium]